MDCTQALTQLNAWLDGELTSAEETAALESHLAGCGECRAACEALQLQDAELRRTFAPLRAASDPLAARVIAALEPARPANSQRPAWLMLLAATAAGYLIAIFTWRTPVEVEQANLLPAKPPIARVALATGPVELLSPPEQGWFMCPTSTELAAGATLRTDAVTRCEVATQDGSQMRLNCETQVQFPGVRQVSLTHGQLWSNVSGGESPFCVSLPKGKVTTDEGKLSFSCQPDKTVVTILEGSARVESGDQSATLHAGQSATIAEDGVSEVQRVYNTGLVTSWINELLALKGPDDPEFTARMNDILAQLGQTKLSHLYEEEFRLLGDHCVLPLVRFLESSRSRGDDAKRVQAAGIVADVAQPRSIGLLIELLADENPDVRFHAARGLERLTSRDQGRPAALWKSEPAADCAPTQRAWQEWWDANRNRYPGQLSPGRTRTPVP